jgi:hypothetical protein
MTDFGGKELGVLSRIELFIFHFLKKKTPGDKIWIPKVILVPSATNQLRVVLTYKSVPLVTSSSMLSVSRTGRPIERDDSFARSVVMSQVGELGTF